MRQLDESLRFHPVGETVCPLVHGQTLFLHPKAMDTFRIDVQFDGMTRSMPGRIQADAMVGRNQGIVGGANDKQRGGIRRHGQLFRSRCIDGRGKIRTARRVVLQGDRGCDRPACREAHDANLVRRIAALAVPTG